MQGPHWTGFERHVAMNLSSASTIPPSRPRSCCVACLSEHFFARSPARSLARARALSSLTYLNTRASTRAYTLTYTHTSGSGFARDEVVTLRPGASRKVYLLGIISLWPLERPAVLTCVTQTGLVSPTGGDQAQRLGLTRVQFSGWD